VTVDLRRSVAALAASVARPPADPAALRDDTSLLGGGLDLDSLSMLELVVGLEKLGVAVAAEDVVPANFGTFSSLLAYARAHRVGGPGAAATG
jgi:acyl carrier protein